MSKTPVCILIAFAAALAACGAPEDPAMYTGDQLHFGQGGGFTGEVNYFILLDDGRLYEKGASDSTNVLRDRWKQNFTQQMFHNYRVLHLEAVEYQHPGNLYYFIVFYSEGQPRHQITWGATGDAPPAHVIAFYQTLYKSTRSKS